MAIICEVMIKYFWILLLFHLIVSCSPKNEVTEEELFRFVALECSAIQLKNKRFELFEEIRRIEVDSVIYAHKKDSLDKVAVELKENSLLLAEKIRKSLDTLFYTKLTNEAARSSFYNKVELSLNEHNCISK